MNKGDRIDIPETLSQHMIACDVRVYHGGSSSCGYDQSGVSCAGFFRYDLGDTVGLKDYTDRSRSADDGARPVTTMVLVDAGSFE